LDAGSSRLVLRTRPETSSRKQSGIPAFADQPRFPRTCHRATTLGPLAASMVATAGAIRGLVSAACQAASWSPTVERPPMMSTNSPQGHDTWSRGVRSPERVWLPRNGQVRGPWPAATPLGTLPGDALHRRTVRMGAGAPERLGLRDFSMRFGPKWGRMSRFMTRRLRRSDRSRQPSIAGIRARRGRSP
jgi:hypothetical protein